MNFSVFYTCYTEVDAVAYAIDTLKTIYPDCPVYLVSDGGSNYSFLETKYANIKTNLEFDSRGFVPQINDNFRDPDQQFLIKQSILTFLDRTKRAIEYGQKDYLLVMEPDVLVRGKLSNPNNNYLLGTRINSGLSDELKQTLQLYPQGISIDHWGATPAIFNSQMFLKAYDNFLKYPELLDKLCLSDKRLANYDIVFPVLFATIGIVESFNPEIVECYRNPEWQNNSQPLVHQFRAKYPTASQGYTGRHSDNEFGSNWLWNNQAQS
jgi:hypothetical protein